LQEERRREILAKLSSERQAALRSRHISAVNVEGGAPSESRDAIWSVTTPTESKHRTAEERRQLVQKLLGERSTDIRSGANAVPGLYPEHIDADREDEASEEFEHNANACSSAPSVESDDEIYYASDILDDVTAVDVQPRSRLDFIYEGEELPQAPDLDYPVQRFSTAVPSLPVEANGEENAEASAPSSLFAKLLGQDRDAENSATDEVVHESFDEDHRMDESWEVSHGLQGEPFVNSVNAANIEQFITSMKKPSNRIDFLAQPRNQTFAEREKQRLLLEMEQLRECTFRPNVLKPPRSIPKGGISETRDSIGRPGTTEFQWLTLSPRQKLFRPADADVDTADGHKENGGQNVIQRLHLDGTARYDSRERAREALESQKLQECTFKPKINPTSKSMFSMVDYKPIHDRVSDLQRAKVRRSNVFLCCSQLTTLCA
jgi:hypothetical protein